MRGTNNLFLLITCLALLFVFASACLPTNPVTSTPTAPTTPTTPIVPTTPVTPPSPTPSLTPSIPATPVDIQAPYVVSSSPVGGSTDVDPATIIQIELGDGSGVDTSSIKLKVSGREVKAAVTPQRKGASITYKPETPFAYLQFVSLELFVRDIAPIPNETGIRLDFTIAPRPKNFPPVVNSTGNLRLMVVYYGKHSPDIDEEILSLRPQYMIANTAHGLWGEIYGHGTEWLLHEVDRYQASDIKVIGYITAGYEGKGSGGGIENKWYTLEMNRKLIENMATLDGVDGVFIDECHTFPDASGKEYLKGLTDFAHKFGLIVWGNVGSEKFDEWFLTQGGFDFMNAQEEWRGQNLTPVQKEWGDKLSVTGQSTAADAKAAYELTIDAWNKGLAYVYISESLYNSLPSWIIDYKLMLREYATSQFSNHIAQE